MRYKLLITEKYILALKYLWFRAFSKVLNLLLCTISKTDEQQKCFLNIVTDAPLIWTIA